MEFITYERFIYEPSNSISCSRLILFAPNAARQDKDTCKRTGECKFACFYGQQSKPNLSQPNTSRSIELQWLVRGLS